MIGDGAVPHGRHQDRQRQSAPKLAGQQRAGVCITSDDQLVLISGDQRHWGFPGGRPEGNEPPEQTLHREVLEEAGLKRLR